MIGGYMDKRERVLAVMNGQKPDKVPSGFWLHFGPEAFHGEKAVSTHLRFFEDSKTDICKIMNENLIPQDHELKTAADWSNLQPLKTDSEGFIRQVELVRTVADAVKDKVFLLATIHGVVASASHLVGGPNLYDVNRKILVRHLRENPEGMKHGLRIITDYLVALAQACLDAGADGIYYAALGGERAMFDDHEFAEVIRPLDLQVLEAADGRTCYNVLHICKEHVNLERYLGYPGEVVNWGIHERNPSLTEGKAIFPGKILLGGLDDRSGVLVDGSKEDITAAVHAVLDEMGDELFFLGADCTLPSDIDLNRIRLAVDAVNSYHK